MILQENSHYKTHTILAEIGYNRTKVGDFVDLRDFSLRLSQLRDSKGVSARDMSLSIGQNPGYINNIENGKSKPSLDGILFICDYLGVTPSEFFDLDSAQPVKAMQLYNIAKHMNPEELDHLIAIARAMTK